MEHIFWLDNHKDGAFIRVLPGIIESNLKEYEGKHDPRFDAAIDGLEALLLAMVSAGINMNTEQMEEAVKTAVEGINNNF